MRLKVSLHIDAPLSKGFFLKREKEDKWIFFTCEKVQRFCFKCGRLSHISIECERNIEDRDDWSKTIGFGPWMTASSSFKEALDDFLNKIPCLSSTQKFVYVPNNQNDPTLNQPNQISPVSLVTSANPKLPSLSTDSLMRTYPLVTKSTSLISPIQIPVEL